MIELWKDIDGFDGYQISNKGRVRSFWKRSHIEKGYGVRWVLSNTPHIMKLSDDGNGYLKVMLTDHRNNVVCCRKVHRLVAKAFIPNHNGLDTVDHIRSGPDGKLDNSVENLRWMSRRNNIQKAYRDGMCTNRIERQKKSVIITDDKTGRSEYFESIKDAAAEYGVHYTTISHCLRGDSEMFNGRYVAEYPDREEEFLRECASYWFPDDY